MSEAQVFYPPRRRGLMFHIAAGIALASTSVFTFFFGINQQAGGYFVLLLVLSLLMFAPLPLIIYRAYALMQATYRLERNGLRLRWGMRAEDIPLPDIEWVRRAEDVATNVPIPRLSYPGAMLGRVTAADLGPVEYLASTGRTLLLIATPRCIYAISPNDPDAFLRAFQSTLELGSLTPISSVSVLPAVYLSRVWTDAPARALLISGFLLTLLLFVGVSLVIPTRPEISLGFFPTGEPVPAGPAAQMMLLPIIGAFFFVGNLATGLFFYRRAETRPAGYLVWGSAVLTSLLLCIAALLLTL